MKLSTWHWSAAAVIAGSACSTTSEYSTGEMGRVKIEINNPHTDIHSECFVACAVDHPLMLGTTESLSMVDTEGKPFLHARSSDATILTIEDHATTYCTKGASSEQGDHYSDCLARGGEAHYYFSYNVTAVGEGTAKLEMFTADERLYDRLELTIHRASTIDIQQLDENGYSTVKTVTLAGQHTRLRARIADSAGDTMFANAGVAMEVPDMNVAAFNGKNASANSPYAELWPLARGTDHVTVNASGTSATFRLVSR